jgi:hypothetical protein
MTEAELLSVVLECASLFGWRSAHFRPAQTSHGWRTAVSGDGKGFVDVLLVGHGRVLFRELKSTRGRLSPDQQVWRDHLLANGADWGCWHPGDWLDGSIEAELRRPQTDVTSVTSATHPHLTLTDLGHAR